MGTILFSVVATLLALALVGLAGIVFQLLRQQGTILVRLDTLDARMAQLAAPATPASPPGVPVGTPVAPFRLPDFVGRLSGLEDFPGKRLLLHWSPDCGFCELVADELGQLQGDLRRHGTQPILVSWGDVEANRSFAEEHGLQCPILLQEGAPPLSVFDGLGTPSAYAVDEDGRTAEPVAVGADSVLGLVRSLAHGRQRLASERPLGDSRLERDGLPAGTTAPSFELPALDGTRVALEDLRGGRVLLVFTDPGCGPCNALAPELAQLHERARGRLSIVMVTRGDVEENRRKASEHGLPFPVVVQNGWRLSKQYGIFATPVAFLVDEHGVIARDVARGREEILDLADHALSNEEVVATAHAQG